MADGVLNGIRILDLAQDWAGAMAGLLLADQGAELVRVDTPDDPVRRHPGARVWLRGRRSISLDLGRPEGREVVRKLAQSADVAVVQAQPGVGVPEGLRYDDLAADAPRLIYCAITAWGEEGPLAESYGHDHLVAARTGVHDQVGWREGPTYITAPMPSIGASILAVQGIGAALFARERTGRGQKVSTSLMAGALAMQPGMVSAQNSPAQAGFGVAARHPFGSSPFYRIYECADGRWLHFGCLTPRLIQNGIRALNLEETIAEERFGDGRAIPTPEARQELIEILIDMMKQRPYHEWAELFEREDVPHASPQWTTDFMDDSQVRHMNMVAATDDPEVGPMEQPGLIINFLGDPVPFPGVVPLAGQHTEEALAELGYAAEDVARLRGEGVVPQP